MPPTSPVQKRRVLVVGLGIGVALGCLIAFVGQTLAPSLAKVPGFLLCGGGDLELVLRRPTSYGACADGSRVHYGLVLVVSSLVWSAVCSPLGLLVAYVRRPRATPR